ncbi:MAG TPA: hypothetical protein VJG83_04820 [archaeon]|nr:hypothetical protein [archaeon]
MDDFFGLAGLILILIAWIPGVVETIKSKKPKMEPQFIVLYFAGSASLAIYALQLNALPFLALNLLAALVPMINLYYYAQNKTK